MLLRPKLANRVGSRRALLGAHHRGKAWKPSQGFHIGLFFALVASATVLLSGCSSSSPRDINYGTDVGLGFVPPDAAPKTAIDGAAIDGAAIDSDHAYDSQLASDSDPAIDGGVVADAAIDGAAAEAEIPFDSANAADGEVVVEAAIDAAIDGDS
jgi:hypothetical protein